MSMTMAGRETAYSQRVAAEIRAWMGRLYIRQSQLARLLGENDQWLSARLRGSIPIDVNELDRIAKALSTGGTKVEVTALIPKPLDLPYGRVPDRPRDNRPSGHGPNGHNAKPIQSDPARRPVRCRTATPPTPSDTRRYRNGRMIPALRSVA